MLGFRRFGIAEIAISGIELVRKIGKRQFNITECSSCESVRSAKM
jgi:hypothetical protein